MRIIVLLVTVVSIIAVAVLFWRSPRQRFKRMFGYDPDDDYQRVRSAIWCSVLIISDEISRFRRYKAESESKIKAITDPIDRYYEHKALEYYCAMLKGLNAKISRKQKLATKFCFGFVSREAAKLTYRDFYVTF